MSDKTTQSKTDDLFEVRTGLSAVKVPEAVLFPFDEYCVPFKRSMKVELQSPAREGIVVAPGPAGSPDSCHIQYYGTVLRVGDELRMWYLGRGDGESETVRQHDLHICYATSRDGVNWARPALGLVEYNGNTQNNRVRISGLDEEDDRVFAVAVLYEPDDPDPGRRFKMALEVPPVHGMLCVATSAEGLDWQCSPANPVGPLIEFTGITKFDGCYYLAGQGSTDGRALNVLASYDFEHWTMAPATGLSRNREGYNQNRCTNPWLPPMPLPVTREVHVGAGLWNRGNVILAVYGDWQWNPIYPGDRRHVRIDLGLLTSPDCLHYSEPQPDFPLISATEHWEAKHDWEARLVQGQGFENVGDKTLFWHYGGVEGSGVRLATWPRDRIACLRMTEHALKWQLAEILGPPHFMSCPVTALADGTRMFLNVDFSSGRSRVETVSEHAWVEVELCDEQFRPLPDYSGDNVVRINEGGLHVPVKWKGKETLPKAGKPFRVRVNYGGARIEDVRVFAVYLESGGR